MPLNGFDNIVEEQSENTNLKDDDYGGPTVDGTVEIHQVINNSDTMVPSQDPDEEIIVKVYCAQDEQTSVNSSQPN